MIEKNPFIWELVHPSFLCQSPHKIFSFHVMGADNWAPRIAAKNAYQGPH